MQRVLIVFFVSFIFSTTMLIAHYDDEYEYREPIKEVTIDKKALEKIVANGHNSDFTFKAESRKDIVISGFKTFASRKSVSKEDQTAIFATLSLKAESSGSTLEITTDKDRDEAEDLGIKLNNYGFSLKVLVPEKMNIEAETHNGSIHTKGGIFSTIDNTTHNGSQTYTAKRFETFEVESHNGSIIIKNTIIADAQVTTHNGEIKLEKTKCTKAKIEGHNGNIILKDTEGIITAEDHNGHFEAQNVLFIGNSKVTSHNGDIDIDFDSRSELKIIASSEHGFPFQNQDITESFKIDKKGESFFIELGRPKYELALQTDNGEIRLKK